MVLLQGFQFQESMCQLIGRKPSFPDAGMNPTIPSDTTFPGSYQGYYSPKGKISPVRAYFALFFDPGKPRKTPRLRYFQKIGYLRGIC
jgi:hypothetical protein